ncbi:hypothetical protein COT66_01040 [Candidatus Shapirobacteria bacterium CG09_land_8_20_14_0_10_49_15]|uniref:Membrane protein 6-pyruvoyl-tetrahydropterin synthase-related domain-containing protein n=1 Tax=Candidatus Shapirobacteria bacterium CG09_land_8_20_14_0_10_49_15 TaxID=1974482 RepID=A0A2M6XB21_9BACT|nr:MAG: hypothetical protein COT66_01040 [Candidatus Shapirobacteria bacterium CG09_land_8_20_14_0_10_49_15]
MRKIFKKASFWPALIALIAIIICVRNYSPGTWLTGWDTLHPEFSFSLGFGRAISGAWQEHQGLGATASQAHAAELPRLIFLFLASLLLPVSFLRYFYFFVCLLLGPLGVYSFLKKIVFEREVAWRQNIPAFLGALFYLLNLGTVQHFVVPLEMFATQYAALGWLFLLMTQFIQTGKKNCLLLFGLVSFLAAPMAHTATLFYVYLVVVVLYLAGFLIFSPQKIFLRKRIFLLFFAILVTNFFWLGPNLYYVCRHSGEVEASKIHQLFTDEAIAQGQEFSGLAEVALFKSFLFNWQVYQPEVGFGPLLRAWQVHLNNPEVSFLGYLFFLLVAVGLATALFKKEVVLVSWLPVFIFLFFFMMILNPLLSPIYSWLIGRWSLAREILRFPFTKFSILLIFVEAIFFGQAVRVLFAKRKIISLLVAAIITGSLIFYMRPAFAGYLVSPQMRIKIPNEYFEMFAWFDQQTAGRILKLPMPDLWGWNYYGWGYQGAGFLWFGLKQPLLDREFDRWSQYNQEAYRELSYALYSQNSSLLSSFVQKYNINWILLDENIFDPNHDQKVLLFEETKVILSQQNEFQLAKKFGPKISIYKVGNLQNNKIYNLQSTEEIVGANYDKVVSQLPAKTALQLTRPEKVIKVDFEKFFLFPENCGPILLDQSFAYDLLDGGRGFKLSAQAANACVKLPLFQLPLPLNEANLWLKVDLLKEGDANFCLFDNRLGRCAAQRYDYPFFEIVGGAANYQLQFSLVANAYTELKVRQLSLTFYKQNSNEEAISLLQEGSLGNLPVLQRQDTSCGIAPQKYFRKITGADDNQYIEYFSQNGNLCDTFYYPQLPHNQGYALLVESKNIQGLPIRFCLTNYQTRRCDLDIKLHEGADFKTQLFLIPPQSTGEKGFDLNLSNYSIGQVPSVNQLKAVKIFPVDYQWLAPIDQKNKRLFFDQSFDSGWLALGWEDGGPKLLKHVLINNWANGWELNNEGQRPWIFFWPQGLEYLGFLVLAACFWWGFRQGNAQNNKNRRQYGQIKRVADLKKAQQKRADGK